MTPSLRRARSRAGLLLAATAATGGMLTALAVPAHADAPVPAPALVAAPTPAQTVLATAQQYVGTPYLWGGTTPAGFDCSGYTQFVFARVGVLLPRIADAQMRATRWVLPTQAAPGDLVFFTSGGYAYHAAVYAGNGWIYDSSGSGGGVSLRPMWTADVVYGRVLG